MEFLQKTKIDFMRHRRTWITVSSILVVVAIFVVFVRGHLNLGIDFAGGTQLTVRFAERPEVQELRRVLEQAGISDAQIQRFGDEVDNEVMIKTPAREGSEEGSRAAVEAALHQFLQPGEESFDLNRQGTEALASLLVRVDPDGQGDDGATQYREIAESIMALRREEGLIFSWEQLAGLPGVSAQAVQALERESYIGAFSVLGAENVGPQIGAEISRKGILAVALSLIGILAYIWVRFELRFGIGALIALLHDVLIVLGLFALMRFEFNVTTIAAFLTLVGYSVNDSVVVFDRVRENLRRSRREPLITVINRSLNQTMSRTILTSGTTLLAVGPLFLFGGDVLRGFAFVLMVGVVVGTYSSIFIASPFTLLWESLFGAEAKASGKSAR